MNACHAMIVFRPFRSKMKLDLHDLLEAQDRFRVTQIEKLKSDLESEGTRAAASALPAYIREVASHFELLDSSGCVSFLRVRWF